MHSASLPGVGDDDSDLAKKPGQADHSGYLPWPPKSFNLNTGLFALAIFHPACLGAGGGVKNR